MALASSASEMPIVVSLAPSGRKAHRTNSSHVFTCGLLFRQSDPIAERLELGMYGVAGGLADGLL